MKLYIYEHCPFCVRARMIFAMHKIPVEIEVLLNDDEATPISLVGAKQVPILIKDDGTAMPESLDIVKFVDDLAVKQGKKSCLSEESRAEIKAWLQELSPLTKLCTPKIAQLQVEEFKTESARNYFINKKISQLGSFEDLLAQEDEFVKNINQKLLTLENLIVDKNLGLEDILLFPVLRNLSIIKKLDFPTKVKNYLTKISKECDIENYFSIAI